MQQFIYHMVPNRFFGDTLFPLNRLKEINEEVYALHRAKYEDHPYRKTLPFRKVPKLNCLWNDVVHFSPVNPKVIYREWARLGCELNHNIQWFAVPVSLLANMPVGVFHCRPENWSMDREFEDENEYSLVDVNTYREETCLRQETLDFYKSLIADGRRGPYFMYIPHILVKGDVDVSKVDRFLWSDPL